ncbi:phosphate ABC transporter substrate-binding protein PstS [Mycolicibacter longobardus]|uniref:Phosphate-binding protein n=1 Tax=Mycolicibacter longobardus TaxID=1108812 RepID=A0A1X1YJS1_9MYCO|nr:phosphate ABC transporter substrate-binding protein PstS [Mycolicibacter longobardus]MCV7385432.1 phosphate ABC transporter substrate-binding protein PstS [Mycolicibacter longobardus]ORW11283.1 phosphate-binding protein [Mycolicibacter longobardus]
MKPTTAGLALMAATVTGLALSGCGSDDNTAGSAGTGTTAGTSQSAACGGKNTLTAEGSTAQQNAIAVFNQVWGKECSGKNLSYNPTGSGAGREQFIAGHVDIAGSDSPLSDTQVAEAADRCGGGDNPAWHLPLVFGPVSIAYHLDGVEHLVLNGDVLARIFSGAITSWDDPALVALNPGANLPAIAITPIYRSDSSGTTDNFQKYLSAAAPQTWTKGEGSEFQGGVGEGAQKSAGVVQAVQSTPGAVGYVEKGFADQANLRSALIDSGAGAVAATDETAGAAIQSAGFVSEDSNDMRLDLRSLYGTKQPAAYPLVLVTYEIVCSKGYDPDTSAAVKSFLRTASGSGQNELSGAGYVRLPDQLKRRLSAAIDAIQ